MTETMSKAALKVNQSTGTQSTFGKLNLKCNEPNDRI